jgi:cold shock CspA family protein
MFLPFTELNVGFINAENYKKKENKAVFSRYFVGDVYLERLLDHNVYFLVGEKGTGKTAYATFLADKDYKNHRAKIYDVRQTEYQKFLELKKQGYLPLSEYAEVWRTLLLMAVSTTILEISGTPSFLKRFSKLKSIKSAIDEFYNFAFAPELVKMISFIQSADVSSDIIAKHMNLEGKVGTKLSQSVSDSKSVFQISLLRIRRAFEAAISSLKLDSNLIIFIDGIDVRPTDVAYKDYFECVQGLIEGIWALNNDYLANIKDSKGRIRVVLSVRPDTFLHTSIHNANTKLRENSVFLDWMTTYKDYRNSLLFKVADHLLAAQQNTKKKEGESWDYYFPFQARSVKDAALISNITVSSFLVFIRFSYYRPRDIFSMIAQVQDFVKRNRGQAHYVTVDDFDDPSFRDAHANYLLGEVRDQLLFYYSQREYELFLQLFPFLHGKTKFTYEDYIEAYSDFITECKRGGEDLPKFFETSYAFLQFMYEQNVICYKEKGSLARGDEPDGTNQFDEGSVFFRWCFRERTLSNMAPKVKTGVEYEIFYGLTKALNLGLRLRRSRAEQIRHVGTIINIKTSQGFGFLRGGDKHREYYFKTSDFCDDDFVPRVGTKVSFEITEKYGKLRAISIRRTK